MIRIIACVLALAACGGARSSTPASPPPAPVTPETDVSPPPPVVAADPSTKTERDMTDAWVNGIHVLVKRIPGAETVSTQLYIQGGVRNWSKADAGIERLAIVTAASGGTTELDKDAFAKKLADLGSSIGGGTSNDFSNINAWSLLPAWEPTFTLLVGAFRTPALPASEIELRRVQQLAALKREQDDPDAKLQYLMHQGIFRGHPYEHRAIGTIETVSAAKREQLVAHLAKLRETSRLLLVVVGDVEPQRVIDTTKRLLGDLPRGTYRGTPLPPWKVDKPAVTIVEQQLPTSYIEAVFPGPSWREPEYAVARVAMGVLGQRMFEEVRTKRNLSYAPAAFFANDEEMTFGGIYVTAVDPKTTMQVMLAEAKRLRDELVPAEELAGTKSIALTTTLMQKEAPAQQAYGLALAEILAGDWRWDLSLSDRIRAVTAEQVRSWASRKITRMRTFVVGDKSKIDVAPLEKF